MIRKLIVETTMRCDLACLHCLQGPKSAVDFPLDVLPRLLEEARPFGPKHVVLTGGEPHLHPEFDRLVEIVHEAGYTWSFVSSGWKALPYVHVMNRFRETCSHATLSLDGATAETHDAIRGRAGAFDRVVISAEHYRKIGFEIRLQASINKLNMRELEAIAQLAIDLGAASFGVAGTIPTTWNTDLQLSEEERLDIYERVKALQQEIGLTIRHGSSLHTAGGVNFCPVLGPDSLTFNPRGEMILCCDIQAYGDTAVIGSAVDRSLPALLNGWLDVVNGLKKQRVEMIAANESEEVGFDTCAFCNRYFTVVND
jgi:MoaA/NifB/PqqE/SkfB family radical SAM enzyme